MVMFACYTPSFEPKNVKKALTDDCWIIFIQEELEQFERNDIWELVPRPNNVNVIGTKWIFQNKIDEFGNITRKMVRLVAQGYAQVEDIYLDETFALIARIEFDRLLLVILHAWWSLGCFKWMSKVHSLMDFKGRDIYITT